MEEEMVIDDEDEMESRPYHDEDEEKDQKEDKPEEKPKIVDINFILIAKLIKEVNDGIKNILNY